MPFNRYLILCISMKNTSVVGSQCNTIVCIRILRLHVIDSFQWKLKITSWLYKCYAFIEHCGLQCNCNRIINLNNLHRFRLLHCFVWSLWASWTPLITNKTRLWSKLFDWIRIYWQFIPFVWSASWINCLCVDYKLRTQ